MRLLLCVVALWMGLGGPAWGDRHWTVECDEEEPQCVDNDTGLCTLSVSRATDDPDFLAANIADGVNILGVTGTLTVLGDTTTGLTHWWKFDETSGTNATDTVGGHTGVLNGGSVWAPNEGLVDGALYQDGVNDFVQVASPALPTGDFTYSLWLRSNIAAATMGLFATRNAANTDEFAVSVSPSTGYSLNFDSGTNVNLSTTAGVTTPQWHLYTLTRTGETLRLYVDGAFQWHLPAPGTLDFSTCAMNIGARASGTCAAVGATSNAGGWLDDMRVYSRGLTAQDVRKLYADVSDTPTDHTAANDLSTNLVLHLPFEENTGTAIDDSGPNNHDGLLVNGPTWIAGAVGSYAVNLDGSNDYISVATPNLPTGDYTYAGWFKHAGTLVALTLFAQLQSAATATNSLEITRSNSFTNLSITVNNVTTPGTNIPGLWTSTWTHFATTRRGTATRTYINGLPVSAGTYGTAMTTDNACALIIGMDPDATPCTGTPSNYFTGGVDDVWIFSRALNDSEIAALAAM